MQELYDRYSKGLRRCVDRVYADGSDADLADKFRANVSRFAAYKADYVKTTVSNILNDASIPLKQRQEMADAAVAGFDRYSDAECNTATSRCRTAKQWKEFNDPQRLRLFPNLRWIGTRSANPRQTHKLFEDKVWAKDDDFWKKNMPGQEWNCKCDLEETDDPVTDNSNVKTVPVPKGLEGNPSVTGEIFTDKAGYIRKARAEATSSVIRCVRQYNRDLYANINTNIETEIGSVLIDKITVQEVTKGAATDTSYFLKQEIALHIDNYVHMLKALTNEAIDLSHNNHKSIFYQRKKLFKTMKVYELEVSGYKFQVKMGEFQDGSLNLYAITEP